MTHSNSTKKAIEFATHLEATIHGACELLGNLKSKGMKTREQSKQGYETVLEAHALMARTPNSALLQHNGQPVLTLSVESRCGAVV